MAFLMVGCVHVALMVMVLKVTGTMVAGWQVFGMVPDKSENRTDTATTAPPPAAQSPTAQTQQQPAAAGATGNSARRTAVAAAAPYIAANDTGGSGSGSIRETRILTSASGSGQAGIASTGPSRTRGLGTRFKPAPARSTEKLK